MKEYNQTMKLRKSQKSVKVECTAASKDFESQLSPVSEVSDGAICTEKNLNAEFTAISEDFSSPISKASDISSISKVSDGIICTATLDGYATPVSLKIKSLEVEVIADHLKEALLKIMDSTDLDNRTKKLVNALVSIALEKFNGLPEEKHLLSKIVTAENCVMLISFVLWIFFISVVLFRNTGVNSGSYSGFTPT